MPLDLRVLIWNFQKSWHHPRRTRLSSPPRIWPAFWWPVCTSILLALGGPETHRPSSPVASGAAPEGRHRSRPRASLPQRTRIPDAYTLREQRGAWWEQVTSPNETANSGGEQWWLSTPINEAQTGQGEPPGHRVRDATLSTTAWQHNLTASQLPRASFSPRRKPSSPRRKSDSPALGNCL